MRRTLRYNLLLALALVLVGLCLPAKQVLAASWWDASWTYRRRLTFDNSASGENLAYFPVLVYLNSTYIDWTKVQNAGEDIRFVDSNDSTELDYEIEAWNDTINATIWVEVPQIDSGVATDFIYMYYGNAGAADGQDVNGTWNSEYQAVYHKFDNPDASNISDSSVNSNNGTKQGAGNPSEVAGLVANAQNYNGTTSYIFVGHPATLNISGGAITLEALFNSDNLTGTRGLISKCAWGSDGYRLATDSTRMFTQMPTTGTAVSLYQDGGSIATGNWYYGAAVYDKGVSKAYIYQNGVLSKTQDSATGDLIAGNTDLYLGRGEGAYWYFDGTLDEARVSNSVRSADWIEAQYLSMTRAYVTFGSEESVPAAPPTAFTLTAINTSTVGVNWTNDPTAVNTTIRRKINEYPSSRTDGTLVYLGSGASTLDSADDVGLELDKYVYYYRAWSVTSLGSWSADYIGDSIGGENMNNLTLFLVFPGIIGMTLLLAAVVPTRKNLLLSLAAALFWLAIGFWWVLGNPFPGMGLTGDYVDILYYIPFLFFFVVLLEYMTRANRVEIQRTLGGRQWTEFGTPPSSYESGYDRYRDQLRGRTRR